MFEKKKLRKRVRQVLPGLMAFLFLMAVHLPVSALQYYVDLDFVDDGTGTGGLDPANIYFSDNGETSYDVEAGDVDGDGDIDIIVTNNGQNRLFINIGNGLYIDKTDDKLPLDSGQSFDADFGDIDGDGDLDIIVVNALTQNRLYINDGTGSFTDETASRLPVDSDKGVEGDFGDVDGDGDLDIIVVNNSVQNRLLINDGTGFFTDETASRLPVESFGDCDGDFGDVDGDGDLDLAVGNCATLGDGDQSRLLINDGTGVFIDETSARIPAILDRTGEIELGLSDVDGDGDLDILMANGGSRGGQQNRILINDGFGYFTEETSTRLPGFSDSTKDIDLGDVDGDGDLDVIVTNVNGEQNNLLINNGSGVFSDQTVSRLPIDSNSSFEADFADVDGDGDLDIIVANINNDQNSILINDGTGNFAEQITPSLKLPLGNDTSLDADFGDIDGDGDLDIIVVNALTQNRLYINDGTGSFTDETASRLPVDSDKGVEGDFGDVDGDGDLDIIVVNNSVQNRLLINDGTGFFTDETASRLPVESFGDCDGDFGDVDGDGDLDLAVGNCATLGDGDQSRLLINDGTGVFIDETSARIPAILDRTGEIELGLSDVDGDGDLDILMANGGSRGGQQNRILINDGFGYFTEETSTRLPGFSDSTKDIDLGDVDGDGDLDVIVTNVNGEQNNLLINNGSGVFSDQTVSRLPIDSNSSFEADFADVDGDGDLDIIVANINNDQNSILINDGTGNFADETGLRLPIDSNTSYDMEFGDVDGDGDLDIIMANNGQNRLYINNCSDCANTAPVLAAIGDQIVERNTITDVPLLATDVDDDAITFSSPNLPAFATIIDNGDGTGTLKLSPGSLDAGVYSGVIIEACDATECANETITITVNDDPPVLDSIGDQTVEKDVTTPVSLSASDPDGDGITFSSPDLPAFATIIDNGDGTATLSLAPVDGDEGIYPAVIIEACDDTNPILCDSETITITVNDDPPVLDPIGNQTVIEGTTTDVSLIATDPDTGEGIIFSGISLPAFATIIDNGDGTGILRLSPVIGDAGAYGVDILACDDIDPILCDTETIIITVNSPNSAPTATSASITTDEDTTSAGVTPSVTDPDVGDTHTFAIVTQPANGTASVVSNQLVYTPNPDFNGSDSFTYSATDSGGLSVNGTASVTVNPINDAPTATSALITTNEDTTSAGATPSVTDVDTGDTHTFAIVTQPASGTASVVSNQLVYTPNADFNGSDSFTYSATDSGALSVTGTASVTVNPINDAPTATSASITTNEDTTSAGVTPSVTDVDTGDTHTFAIVTQPANGTATIVSNQLVYTPNPDFNGSDSFIYSATDSGGLSVTGTASVEVTAVNDAPTATSASITTDEDTTSAGVTPSVTDVDTGDTHTFAIVTQPANGTASVVSNQLVYTPNADFNGSDSFTYSATDSGGLSVTGTASVTVNPINDAPTATSAAITTNEDTTSAGVTPSVTDVDTGDTHTFAIVTQPSNGTATIVSNQLVYTPNADFNGSDSFTYSATDSGALSVTGTASVTVNPINDAPIANAGIDQLVSAGFEVNLDGSGSYDPEGNSLVSYSWTFTSAPTGSSILVGNTLSGIYPTFTPDIAGNYVVQLIVNDSLADSAPDSVTITVLSEEEFEVRITPTTLNLGTEGNPVSVFVDLPVQYPVTDVDPAKLTLFMIFYNCTVEPCSVGADLTTFNVNTSQNKFSIKFPRQALEDMLNANSAWGQDITIRVQGGFDDASPISDVTFFGDDTITVNQ